MAELRLIGRLDRSVGWANGGLTDESLCRPFAALPAGVLGAVAGAASGPGHRYRLLRDPLGLNKVFWSAAGETILVAARPRRLVDTGCAFEDVKAIAPGMVVDLDLACGSSRASRLRLGEPAGDFAGDAEGQVAGVARAIRARLDGFLEALAQAHPSAQVFVCLSGGLDSTGVAVLARQHFAGVTAVSFDLRRPGGRASEDRRTAERLARDLGLAMVDVSVTPDELLDALDTVLVEAVDWRDFNVHAGLVNACLARAIASLPGDGERLVLTGDLPNEFLVDYQPESYRGETYYPLPRVAPATQRSLLVRGLETSHREIGIFEAWGLPVALPYAVAADLFLALPPEFLGMAGRKEHLYRLAFGALIPEYVHARPKTRAQVGDPDLGHGVLAVCADTGHDQAWLRRRFAELHGVGDPGALDRFLRAGRYRAGIPTLEGAIA